MMLNDNQKNSVKELYIEMYSQLFVYANNILNDRSLAEEAVQDTFRIACAKANDFLSSPNPRGWLLNTLKYVLRNMIRSRATLNNLIVTSFDLIENAIASDTETSHVDLLYSDIADSPEYELLKKIVLDKCTILEASQELGISVEACKKRVQRARKKLRKYFEQKY